MHRQHRLRLDALDSILPHLKPLRQIPQEKIDKHAARRGTRRTAARAQSRSDAFHSNDRRGAYGDLFARAAREFFVRLKGVDERGGIG